LLRKHAIAGVGNQGSSGVAHERNRVSACERGQDFRAALRLIVLVIAEERFPDLKVLQKLLGLPRILARDQRYFLPEDMERPQRDVV